MSLPKSDGKGRSGQGESPGQTGDTGLNNGKLLTFLYLKQSFSQYSQPLCNVGET